MWSQIDGHEVDGRMDGEVSAWNVNPLDQMISLPGKVTSPKMKFGRLGT